jgi:putative Mn2+ efflux pump MntP
MTDPILYLSMLLGFGGVYVLISSFHDDDDGDDDDGEKYIYNLEQTFLAR